MSFKHALCHVRLAKKKNFLERHKENVEGIRKIYSIRRDFLSFKLNLNSLHAQLQKRYEQGSMFNVVVVEKTPKSVLNGLIAYFKP